MHHSNIDYFYEWKTSDSATEDREVSYLPIPSPVPAASLIDYATKNLAASLEN